MRPNRVLPTLLTALLLSLLSACDRAVEPAPAYPEAARSDHLDDYFGTQVADPYRWLEDSGAAATQGFVEAQNALARPFLEALPAREHIRRRMTELLSHERTGVPEGSGGRYFFRHNDGRQAQDVLMVAESLDGAPRILVDPNTLSEDATIALARFEASPDGTLVAWAVSDGGTDWRIWRVRRVDSGEDLAEVLEHMKFSGVAWAPDSSGFYYSRYPMDADGRADDSKPVSVYFHRLGAEQSEDAHVYSAEDDHQDPYAAVTDDGRYLLLTHFEGYDANAVYVRDLAEAQASVVPLLAAWDALYTPLGNRGSELFFKTSHRAPNGRVVAIDLDHPDPESWREVVPEGDNVLDEAHLVGGRLLAEVLVDASSRVRLFELDGREVGEVELPGIGSVGSFTGKLGHGEAFFEMQSFTAPETVLRLDPATGETEVFRQPEAGFDAAAYTTRQVFYQSKDGTRVPMFLVHRQGLAPGGDHPTLLHGYGGFNVALTPRYEPHWTVWLEMGGLLAVANLRGGSEYGEAWHRAGTRENKQNVFDDFIAAAEWLIAEGYTSSPRLAAFGRSNGGLLIGAAITQRPDLFGAALPAVGVLDMLRYHTASANAHQWGSDFGWSDNETDFRAQAAYSPVHNVRPGTCYPPTLVTTADRDDRVVPWHSYKFTAALQHAQGCENPILLRVETRAGHGRGKPVWMRAEDYADQWAFVAEHLGMKVGG